MRHGPEVGIIGNDPSEVALFLDRGAYDALCPENAPCLNAQNVAQMQRQGCGHVFVTLLIHAATTRNISVFYTPWAKLRLRLHGLHGMRRGFNGLGPHMAEANAYLADTTDVAETLQQACLLIASLLRVALNVTDDFVLDRQHWVRRKLTKDGVLAKYPEEIEEAENTCATGNWDML
ncbi:hypothetical protein CYMTET_37710 [Cymbomonas tetramitiformis]|uniref:Uncharacterized protein n=1 Tax=Cymbomonas tetramitiformis TaxID=36881 RepID=A0AAE0CDC3_9CHLO|nr:hypothetical protein CYMTET_37710 [Cymbomonas tetramitiformis]